MDYETHVAPGANGQYVTITAKQGDVTEMEVTFIGDEAKAWAQDYLAWKSRPPAESVMSATDVALFAKCQAVLSGLREVLGIEEKNADCQ